MHIQGKDIPGFGILGRTDEYSAQPNARHLQSNANSDRELTAAGEGNAPYCAKSWEYENIHLVSEKWLIRKYSLELAGKHILQMLVLQIFILKIEFSEFPTPKRSPKTVNRNFRLEILMCGFCGFLLLFSFGFDTPSNLFIYFQFERTEENEI